MLTIGPLIRHAWWLWPTGIVKRSPVDSVIPVSSHTGQIRSAWPTVADRKLAYIRSLRTWIVWPLATSAANSSRGDSIVAPRNVTVEPFWAPSEVSTWASLPACAN